MSPLYPEFPGRNIDILGKRGFVENSHVFDAYWLRVNGVTVSVDSFEELIRLGHEVVIICSFYPESQAVERMSTPPWTSVKTR